MKFKEIQNDLKKKLKPSRYRHTLGVVKTAGKLAEIHGCDTRKAEMAALLHDCAKYLDDDTKIAMCREYGVEITETELLNPTLLHAKCGAITAREEYGIRDEEILHAIQVHTTGAPAMNLLDKIIFVADYIEPGRDQAPHLKELRKLAGENIDQVTFRIMEDTVNYLNQHDAKRMDQTTWKAYEYYKDYCSK